MELSFPKSVVTVCFLLEKAGYSAYIVGGAVRDILLQRPTTDWDFTTNATPEQIQAVFTNSFYENQFGTVGVSQTHLLEQLGVATESIPEQDTVFEVTTFRSESAYSDHRRPDTVEWGSTIEEDLQRRDFTINAMALKLNLQVDLSSNYSALPDQIPIQFELIDPFQGKRDLQEQIIRAVGEADKRIEEDALRMLRAVRLAAELRFRLDPELIVAMQVHAPSIEHVSWERISHEILRILVTDSIEDAFTILHTTGLLQYILPEIIPARGIEQRGHHEFDVWTHLLRATQLTPSRDPVVRLAALLHDIAKPETQAAIPGQDGEYSFHNHEVIGARVARDVARRMRLSKEDTQRIFTLVRWHMFHYQPEMTDSAIRRFIRRVGIENIDDIMALREGDRLGSGSKRTSWRLEEMKERIQEQLHQPMKVSDLAVDGNDVMQILGIPPSRRIGEILQELFEEVLEEPEKNVRDYLINKIEQQKTHEP